MLPNPRFTCSGCSAVRTCSNVFPRRSRYGRSRLLRPPLQQRLPVPPHPCYLLCCCHPMTFRLNPLLYKSTRPASPPIPVILQPGTTVYMHATNLHHSMSSSSTRHVPFPYPGYVTSGLHALSCFASLASGPHRCPVPCLLVFPSWVNTCTFDLPYHDFISLPFQNFCLTLYVSSQANRRLPSCQARPSVPPG